MSGAHQAKQEKTCTKKQSVFRNNHHAIITFHRKKEVSQKSNAVTLTTCSCRTLNICSATRTCTGFWCPSNEHRRLKQSDGSTEPHKYANQTRRTRSKDNLESQPQTRRGFNALIKPRPTEQQQLRSPQLEQEHQRKKKSL